MSPREKRFISLVSVGLLVLAVAVLGLYFIPAFLYVTLIVGAGCIVFYCQQRDSIYTGVGSRRPRPGFGIPAELRRWWAGGAAGGGSLSTPGRSRGSRQVDAKFSEVYSRQRHAESDLYRRDALTSDTFLFSPRDLLMGSYIAKEGPAERPPRAGQSLVANPNPREQLRARLARPNHAVYTPNRRLSFAREPVSATGKFVITPQRHYPLLQFGMASVGVLPPAHWDSFKKKNILSSRNSAMVHSPVTVKIARPDHRPPMLDCMGSPSLILPPDPCSTQEGVLKVLRESRKRDVVEDEDGSFVAEQQGKRRRNDSGGSAHSAFEPLLPNGATSQLVPKPGTLKRGTHSPEEAAVKRSRTSSISSGSAAPALGGTPGSARNPINSSYSSSRGLGKWKKTLEHGSPLSSPGSSRSQTPERAQKKHREEEVPRPSSVSMVTPDKTAAHIAAATSKRTPAATAGVRESSESTSSGGKRKRKIQLVSSHRQDQIYLPPPPQLGYTVTGKDLDLEKKDALSKIQKSLEEPGESRSAALSRLTPYSQRRTSAFSSTTTLSSLLAAPLSAATTAPVSVGAPIPVIDLDPSSTNATPQTITTTAAATAALPASNPLLEALKTKSITPSSSPSTTFSSTVSSSGETQTQKPPSSLSSSQPASTVLGQPTSTSAPSAFTQVLNQVTKPVASASIMFGTSLFGTASPLSTATATPTSAPPAYTLPTARTAASSAGATNPLLASGFKPIFMATPPTSTAPPSAQENKPAVPSFKPLFESTGAGAMFGASSPVTMTSPTTPAANPIAGFGGFNAGVSFAAPTERPTLFPGSTSVASAAPAGMAPAPSAVAQPAIKPLTFSFGSVAAMSATTKTPAAQATPQSVFGFGQAAPAQNQPTASFGGFAMAPASAAVTASGTAASNSAPPAQSTFSFAKSAFNGSAALPAFPGLTPAAPKPFGFGTGAPAAPAPAAAPGPFSFGAGTASTAASTFGAGTASTAASTFGAGTASTAASTFGAGTASTAASTFGAGTASIAASTFGAGTASIAASTFGAGTASIAASTFGAGTASTAASTFGAGTASTAASTFGAGTASIAASTFGAGTASTAASTFGAAARPAFGASSTGFAFGGTAATAASSVSAAPIFGLSTQTQSAPPASTFAFGGGAPQQTAALPSQPASGGFNFGSAMPSTPFGTQVPSNAAPQMAGFNFGSATTDKPTFGTPTFGQSAAAGPTPFGSPATPLQSFSSAAPPPFGSPAAPSFSIGAGSKPSGARQRLQARRQHTRKK
ncbi:hypothetical protein NHX12_009900 [Muraenolepis orangiensis]|uniref:POM121 transmembrane nucleoporin n=1 Tax=Muraenolepis orangiensis TaxID=630683 RepID=A0A9Q0DM24_9TELE|nr:hypothetical protein NHX12_009900 [Muraenolepis orangiensis]